MTRSNCGIIAPAWTHSIKDQTAFAAHPPCLIAQFLASGLYVCVAADLLRFANGWTALLDVSSLTKLEQRTDTHPVPHPNIILCMCDQLHAFEVGCYGNPVIRTPNLDWLAAEGVRFETAVTTFPVCMAARSATLSGTRSGRSG